VAFGRLTPLPESNYEERLRAVADEIDAFADQQRLARERRRRLVVEAIDEGNSWATVARWARISSAEVHRTLAKAAS
jgi:hypothetical protein